MHSDNRQQLHASVPFPPRSSPASSSRKHFLTTPTQRVTWIEIISILIQTEMALRTVSFIMRAFCTQQVHSKHFLTRVALVCIRRGTLRTDTGEHFPRTRYSWTVKGVRATRIHTQGWPVIQRASCQLPLCEAILLCLCQPYASQWQNGLMAIISQELIWERLLPTLHLPHLPTKVEKSKQWRTSGLGALRI